jgi:hypothetical protein
VRPIGSVPIPASRRNSIPSWSWERRRFHPGLPRSYNGNYHRIQLSIPRSTLRIVSSPEKAFDYGRQKETQSGEEEKERRTAKPKVS